MIRSLSVQPFVARISACVGVLCCIGCQVYDPGLLDEGAQRRSIRGRDQPLPDAGRLELDAELVDAGSCGDGVVSEAESCDTAIARGNPGACPDGCSGSWGCMRRVLEGDGCDARCIERELTEAVPDDGCCPPETDQHQDNDCAARCGNGHLEAGELCDPADTCPTEAVCENTNGCVHTRFVGAADSCDAHCEVMVITSCRSDDGCCPAGCSAGRDSDCPMCPEGAPCPVEVQPPPMPPPFVCNERHKGSACRSCDCAQCGAEVAACRGAADASDAMLCAAAIDCSERYRCTAGACYCGDITSDSCNMEPMGVCEEEWEAAVRSTSPIVVRALAASPSFTIGKAVKLLECRLRNCAEVCGLSAGP